MKCINCSSKIEVDEDNFCISSFNIIITCKNCDCEILEDEYNYKELIKVYWEE